MEKRITDLITRMTLDEKIDIMHGSRGWHCVTPFTYRLWSFGNRGCRRLGIPAFRFTDGPRGINLGRATGFPVAIARGAAFDVDLEERVATAFGLEARHQGANATGSTCINIIRHPGWGRSQETFGADTFHMSVMGAAHVRGLKKNVMPVIKHFACNSIEDSRYTVSVNIDERPLREIYLPHFRACIEAGAAGVMSAYNRVNGTYCGEHPRLLTDILKNEWGFDGFVISDWFFGCRTTAPSIRAGLDIEMPLPRFYTPKKIKKALRRGEITEAMVDDSVRRIIRQLMKSGLFEPFDREPEKYVARQEHIDLSLETARKGMVLLKNNGLLPFNKAARGTLAVIGRAAKIASLGDFGSSAVRPPFAVSPMEGIRAAAGKTKVVFSKGPGAAAGSDAAVVVISLTHGFFRDEGENFPGFGGGDRRRLELSSKQIRLIKETARRNKNCVVVIEAGGAVCVDGWIDEVAAVIMAWYPGMMGGQALGEILFGTVNPSGRLPVTVPKSTGQIPPLDTESDDVAYDFWHDYRYFDKHNLEPRYPFGFGLSYTSFEYRGFVLDSDSISREGSVNARVTVTNTGSVTGDEVVQLYVGYGSSRVDPRPVKELKGFARVTLDPGEEKTVTITINAKDLAWYNPDTRRCEVEAMEYELFAGPSSRDLPLRGRFRID